MEDKDIKDIEDILETLKTRRSVRSYKSDPVPEELISRVVEAGLFAPTGMNRQATILLVLTDPDAVRTLGKVNGAMMGHEGMDAFYGAPAVICVLAKKDDPTAIFDGSAAITNMLNEAASLGLGSCWIHRGKEQFETKEGREILTRAGIDPDTVVGIDSAVLSFPAVENPAAAPRKEGRVYRV